MRRPQPNTPLVPPLIFDGSSKDVGPRTCCKLMEGHVDTLTLALNLARPHTNPGGLVEPPFCQASTRCL